MRIFVFVLALVTSSTALAQDPTLPSKAILDRIKSEPMASTVVTTAEPWVPAKVVLKAMVMRDVDHGTALIEAEGRMYRLTLDRSMLNAMQPSEDIPGIQIGGNYYRVQDFAVRSVTLFDGLHRIQVQ